MKNNYKLYMFYKDELIGKYNCVGDDWKEIYKSYSECLIRAGFIEGFTFDEQIKKYEDFCDDIHKQKRHCYKIKFKDFLTFLSCYFCLVKLNRINYDDFLFLKCKSR